MSLDPEWLLALIAIAFLAGCIDTLAGGGGLLTIPVLMFAGLQPAQALATNKCHAFAGTLTATLNLTRHGQINWRWIWPYALTAFVCSIAGALTLRFSEPEWLAQWVQVLLIVAAAYFGLVRMPTDRISPPENRALDRDWPSGSDWLLRWIFWPRNRIPFCACLGCRTRIWPTAGDCACQSTQCDDESRCIFNLRHQ